MAEETKKKDNDWVIWALIVFLFSVGLSPLAMLLLVIKLFGGDDKKEKKAPASQPGRAKSTVGKAMKSPVAKRSTARWLKIGGWILLAVGLLGSYGALYDLQALLTALTMAAGGGVMLAKSVSMTRQLARFARYLAVMGDRDAVSVRELSGALGQSVRQVERDLQKMIDQGYFGGRAYLHKDRGYLFRSVEADAAWRQKEEAAKQAKRAPETGYAALLGDIRRANDAIADPILSEKIDRLEAISACIFRAVEEDPGKKAKIDTFLNYYLPTTQKLLDAYAQFEAAGVEGENLRQAKSRIEATMDSIIRGFEHQLDELYRTDAMDVDADIRVMETMLRRDTARVSEDFDMGGAAAQRYEE